MAANLKWIVGGASFGSNYGVSNSQETSQREVLDIIDLARKFRWFAVDTAPVYGRSEEFLGKADLGSLGVFSKLPKETTTHNLHDSVLASKLKLRVVALEGLTFHDQKHFIENHVEFVATISRLKNEGLVHSWGVSVYSPEEIEDVLLVARPDYFQAPVNLLDRRFIEANVVRRLNDSGVQLQARSIFLQGLLANPIDSLPPYFNEWKPDLLGAEQRASNRGYDLRWCALDFIRAQTDISSVVIGVHNANQMEQICEQISGPAALDSGTVLEASENVALIDPRLWCQ